MAHPDVGHRNGYDDLIVVAGRVRKQIVTTLAGTMENVFRRFPDTVRECLDREEAFEGLYTAGLREAEQLLGAWNSDQIILKQSSAEERCLDFAAYFAKGAV